MYWLKIAFVVLLCLPILYFGFRFFSIMLDNAVAGRAKKEKKQKKNRKQKRRSR
jgi:phosphotransferase system  glucose/maltose/N-acetylglucosamine-specific IIC component